LPSHQVLDEFNPSAPVDGTRDERSSNGRKGQSTTHTTHLKIMLNLEESASVITGIFGRFVYVDPFDQCIDINLLYSDVYSLPSRFPILPHLLWLRE
jgi:hypothetical protein